MVMKFSEVTKAHLCTTPVMLNMKPATIAPAPDADVAVVTTDDGTVSGRWTWEHAQRIVDDGGLFRK